MSLHASGTNATIDLFEHHLVINRRQRGILFDGPDAEHMIPLASIKSVQFVRPGFMSPGKIVLVLAAGAAARPGTPADPNTVYFSKRQLVLFENVLRAIQAAIATPSIERLAMAVQQQRSIDSHQSSPNSDNFKRINGRTRNVEPSDEVLDANSTVAPGLQGQNRATDGGLGGLWRDLPLLGKVILIVVPLLFMLSMCSTGEPSQSAGSTDSAIKDEDAETQNLTQDNIVGNWVMTPKGGEDGKTACRDFNTPALYKLNGQTAKILSFGSDGKYRSLLAYTTPSSDEHTETEAADWSFSNDSIRFDNVSIQTGVGGGVGDARQEPVSSPGSNQLIIGAGDAAARYVRCEGSIDRIFPSEIADAPKRYEPVPYGDPAPDFANVCSDQDVINAAAKVFKDALSQVALSGAIAQSRNLDQTLLGTMLMRDRITKTRVKFLSIRFVDSADAGNDFIKIQCRGNIRFLEPIEGADGNWSQYLQFNNAAYAVKLWKKGDSENRIYVVAELRPVDGRWDVEQGTE